MGNIEVELRTVVDREQYEKLLTFFHKRGKLVSEDTEKTWYFDGPGDLRSRQTGKQAKLIYKKGHLFDEQREELEIALPREDFEKAEKFFNALGRKVYIKWLRKRHTFSWQGIKVMLDDTKGYGCVVEFEKLCKPEEKDRVLEIVCQKMRHLGLKPTPREELERRHEEYKAHWRELLGE